MHTLVISEITKPEYQGKVMRKYGFKDWDSVLAAVGHGGLKEGQVVNKLVEEYNKVIKKARTDREILEEIPEGKAKTYVSKSSSGIIVKGMDDLAVRFSHCCNPVPGDEIVGFVTRGRGISIHRTDCINILHLPELDRVRLIDAEWQADIKDKSPGSYSAEITVYGTNRSGLLVDISKIFTERKIDITSMNVRTSKQGTATLLISFGVSSKDELNNLIEKIKQVESVIDIDRTTGG